MKIFFDFEFQEDGKTIVPISIGMVREDEKTLYREFADYDTSTASEWVRANVLPKLTGEKTANEKVAEEIVGFCGDAPEFWGYYADYDWVCLCWLYGRMIDLPKGWPMYCRDIKQFCDQLGTPKLPEQVDEHNALSDALWNFEAWKYLDCRSALRTAGGN